MKRIALFLLIAAVAISTADAQKVKRTKKKEFNGFKWTLLEQDGIKGVEVKKGNIIIPLEKGFNEVKYSFDNHKDHKNGFFVAEKKENGHWKASVFKTNGTEIISADRGYCNAYCEDEGYINVSIYIGSEFYCGLCDSNGREIIVPQPHYSGFTTFINCTGYITVRYKDKSYGVIDTNGREIIPQGRGYTYAVASNSGGRTYIQVKKDKDRGLCDIYGNEFFAPTNIQYCLYISYKNDCFIYHAGADFYLGVKLDDNGHGIPDPDHQFGTRVDEYTAYNNSTTYSTYEPIQTYTPSNPTSTKTSTTSKPSSSTTSPQATAQAPEKCKYCQGSGQCRGNGSVQSIKMHCAGSGRCSTCGGSGLMSTGFGSKTKCSYCNGSGKCQYCKGTGKCDRCNGTGVKR